MRDEACVQVLSCHLSGWTDEKNFFSGQLVASLRFKPYTFSIQVECIIKTLHNVRYSIYYVRRFSCILFQQPVTLNTLICKLYYLRINWIKWMLGIHGINFSSTDYSLSVIQKKTREQQEATIYADGIQASPKGSGSRQKHRTWKQSI